MDTAPSDMGSQSSIAKFGDYVKSGGWVYIAIGAVLSIAFFAWYSGRCAARGVVQAKQGGAIIEMVNSIEPPAAPVPTVENFYDDEGDDTESDEDFALHEDEDESDEDDDEGFDDEDEISDDEDFALHEDEEESDEDDDEGFGDDEEDGEGDGSDKGENDEY